MRRRFLGIDFRLQGVAVLLASSGHKGLWIEAAQYFPGNADAGLESQLETFLENVIPPGERENVWTAIALPASQVAFRNLKVPFKEPKKIRQILPFELEPSLPEGVEGLTIDFCPVQISSAASHILAATIDSSRLRSYRETLANAGLSPQVITIDGYILGQQLNLHGKNEEDCILITVDGRVVTLVINTAGQVASVRAFTLPASLSSALSFSCASVRQTLNAFKDKWLPGYNPQKVLLSGSNSGIFSQKGTIARNLQLPVEAVTTEMIANVSGADPPGQTWREPIFANALALAAQQGRREGGLNFRQDTFTLSKFWDDNRPAILKTATTALLVLAVALFALVYENHTLKRAVDRYDKEIQQLFRSSFPEITTVVDPVHQMRGKISELQEQVRLPLEAGRGFRSIDLLNAMSQQISTETDIEISRLVVGPDGILVSGDTDSFNSVDAIKGQLEQSPLIESVTTVSAAKEKSGDRIQFKLKLTLGESTTS